MADITNDDEALRNLLQTPRNIAMVGASSDPSRDSNRVFAYLQSHGHNVVPVTPKLDFVHGVRPVPDLAAAKERLDGHIDIVDVFRAAQHTPAIAEEAAKVGADAFWLQFNTVHPDAVSNAISAGMDVIVDRCIKIEHAKLC
jgi:predicted CoA-binding protein